MEQILQIAASPITQFVIVALTGWLLKVGWDFGIALIRLHGQQKVERAKAALEKAKTTSGQEDDAVAEAILQKAEESQEVSDKLATLLEQNKPPNVTGGK